LLRAVRKSECLSTQRDTDDRGDKGADREGGIWGGRESERKREIEREGESRIQKEMEAYTMAK
jgi:hypothetical protein